MFGPLNIRPTAPTAPPPPPLRQDRLTQEAVAAGCELDIASSAQHLCILHDYSGPLALFTSAKAAVEWLKGCDWLLGSDLRLSAVHVDPPPGADGPDTRESLAEEDRFFELMLELALREPRRFADAGGW
jgi:hypothetical protein